MRCTFWYDIRDERGENTAASTAFAIVCSLRDHMNDSSIQLNIKHTYIVNELFQISINLFFIGC